VHFEIGDIVYHAATKEQGRILRCLAYNERNGYIVATTNWSGKKSKPSGTPAKSNKAKSICTDWPALPLCGSPI
jgi:hypothetical protein